MKALRTGTIVQNPTRKTARQQRLLIDKILVELLCTSSKLVMLLPFYSVRPCPAAPLVTARRAVRRQRPDTRSFSNRIPDPFLTFSGLSFAYTSDESLRTFTPIGFQNVFEVNRSILWPGGAGPSGIGQYIGLDGWAHECVRDGANNHLRYRPILNVLPAG